MDKTTPQEALKPCPFCGGEPQETDTVTVSSVRCKVCNFSISRMAASGEYAQDLWNRRADSAQAAPAVAPEAPEFDLDEQLEARFRGMIGSDEWSGWQRYGIRLALKMNMEGRGLIDYGPAARFAENIAAAVSAAPQQDTAHPLQAAAPELTDAAFDDAVRNSCDYSITRDKGCFHAGARWARKNLPPQPAAQPVQREVSKPSEYVTGFYIEDGRYTACGIDLADLKDGTYHVVTAPVMKAQSAAQPAPTDAPTDARPLPSVIENCAHKFVGRFHAFLRAGCCEHCWVHKSTVQAGMDKGAAS